MLELFIALFGGLFYGTKYISEKAELISARQERENNSSTYLRKKEDWLARVVDRELEVQLEDFIYHSENYDAVWQEVSDAFSEMPWNKNRVRMYFSPDDVAKAFGRGKFTKKERENIAKNHRKEALRIMMANRGKLCYLDAEFGIENYGVLALTALEMNRWNEQSARFVLWINDQLKKHGVDEKIFVENLNCAAYALESSLSRGGTYKWHPALPHYVEIKS